MYSKQMSVAWQKWECLFVVMIMPYSFFEIMPSLNLKFDNDNWINPLLFDACNKFLWLTIQILFFFFSKKNTPFVSYKVLQKSYVQIPVGMR